MARQISTEIDGTRLDDNSARGSVVFRYLTTKGQPPDADHQMIRDLGFEIVQTTTEVGVMG